MRLDKKGVDKDVEKGSVNISGVDVHAHLRL